EMRPVYRQVRGDAGLRRALVNGLRSSVRARERVGGGAGNRRDADQPAHQRPRRLALRVPRDERIHRLLERVEITPEPAGALRIRGVRRAPDIETGEMRPAGVLVPGPLHDRQASAVEDALEAGQTRVEADFDAATVAPDLEHASGRH